MMQILGSLSAGNKENCMVTLARMKDEEKFDDGLHYVLLRADRNEGTVIYAPQDIENALILLPVVFISEFGTCPKDWND